MTQSSIAPASPVEVPQTETHRAISASRFRIWTVGTLLLAVAASSAFVIINAELDLFGLHGDRHVRIFSLQRFSLYLMSYRFIPDHFDGLLIGNSAGAGYDTSLIRKHSVFNAAMRGATASEERVLAEQVLSRGHLKLLLMVLNPHMLSRPTEVTAYMTPHDYLASFGSTQTMIVALQRLLARAGHPGPITYNDYGQTIFPLKTFTGPFIPYTREQLTIDPNEFANLRELLAEVHAKKVKVFVLFFGPMYQPKWDGQQTELLAWQSKIQPLFSPEDTVIKLPAGLERTLQARRENFPDYVHMTAPTRAAVMSVIEQYVDENR